MARTSLFSRLTTFLLVAVAAFTLSVSRQGGAVVLAGALEQIPTSTDATTHVLSYQGRLVDPTTGAPKADGSYPMTFQIYNAATDGTILWTESKNVSVSKGLFSTLLGDTAALAATIFDGNDRWLGVTVGGDPETTPRMRLAFAPYASYALNAGNLGGQPSTYYRNATNINAGILADARIPDSITRDSEPIGEARIDDAIARDGEVMGIVTSSGGMGSGLDADKLDGMDSLEFAKTVHAHAGTDIDDGTIGTADLADNAVTSAKIANGTITTSDLANGAVTADKIAPNVLHHFININPTGINMDTADGVSYVTGFGPNAGVRLPDANTPSIDFGFVIPPDFVTGSELILRIIWHTSGTNCSIQLAPNYVSVARAGRTHLIGGSVTSGITGVFGNGLEATSVSNRSDIKDYLLTAPVVGEKLQPGDSFIIGLYRPAANAGDTCAADLKIQGIQILY